MRAAALVPLAALALVAAACGSSTSSSAAPKQLSPTASVKKAAAKTAQASSEHVVLSGAATAAGQQVAMRGEGDFDNVKHAGQMTMHATLAGVDTQIDAVMDGTTMYMRSPLLSAALPNGKTWMKIDLQKVGASQGIDFSQLLTQDPAQQLKQLQAAGAMTKVGEETIDGAATTHYRGRIDLAKVPQGAKIQRLTNAKYGPYDVWVGDDGYVHRMRTSYSYAAPGGGARQSSSFTLTYSDFGKDVTVTVPAASETVDATKQSMGG